MNQPAAVTAAITPRTARNSWKSRGTEELNAIFIPFYLILMRFQQGARKLEPFTGKRHFLTLLGHEEAFSRSWRYNACHPGECPAWGGGPARRTVGSRSGSSTPVL